MVVDYRALNDKTKKLAYPFPSLRDQFLDLKGATIFTQLDLDRGYYQIPLSLNSIPLTSFVVPDGQFEFLRLPFGLTNAPRSFQKTMADMFIRISFVKIFLDDILVFSANQETHKKHLGIVMKILEENGARLNIEKSKFYQSEVEYLGIKINKDGITPTSRGSINLTNLEAPKSKRELMKHLGLINWFSPFLPNLSQRLSKITDLLKKTSKFEWNNQHKKIIEQIKTEIANKPMLVFPDYNEVFEIECDASENGIGGVIFQKQGIVGYYSRKLTAPETRYPINEKEALSIIAVISNFKNILYGRKLHIKTDHSNLTFLESSKVQRVQRWRLLLNEYDHTIEFLPGSKNSCADWLSRNLSEEEEVRPITQKLKIENTNRSNLNLQTQVLLTTNQPISSSTKLLIPQPKESDNKTKFKLSDSELTKVVRRLHNDLNHPCAKRMRPALSEIYELRGQHNLINEICETCHICQTSKKVQTRSGLFKGTSPTFAPFQAVAVDLVGPFRYIGPTEELSHSSLNLLTIIDLCTRWVEIVVVDDTKAETVTEAFLINWIQRYPLPDRVVSDRGVQFLSSEFQKLLQSRGIKHKATLAYNPTGNATCERIHREVNSGLRIYQGMKIDLALGNIQEDLRSFTHRSLNTTPLNIVFSRNKWNAMIKYDQESLLARAEETKQKLSQTDKDKANHIRREFSFIGRKVLIKALPGEKLQNPWIGPYQVIEESPERNCLLIQVGQVREWISLRRIKLFKEGQDVGVG